MDTARVWVSCPYQGLVNIGHHNMEHAPVSDRLSGYMRAHPNPSEDSLLPPDLGGQAGGTVTLTVTSGAKHSFCGIHFTKLQVD